MNQAKLSSKYEISLPKTVREELHLEAGQKFTLVIRGNIIELVPLRSLSSARGLLSDCKDL